MGKYKELFIFRGRLSREPFIIRAVISYAVILFCAQFYEPVVAGNTENINLPFLIFLFIILLPALWVFYASANRRFHDTGRGSLWTLIFFIAAPFFIVWLVLLLYLIFKDGTKGDNAYGPDPLGKEK